MVDEKIEAPAKISSRHPAAGPKEDGLTPWAVKGELILIVPFFVHALSLLASMLQQRATVRRGLG